MSDRDRLVELMAEADRNCEIIGCDNCKYFGFDDCGNMLKADRLLSNGVIVPPYKVDDTLYKVHRVWVGSAASYKWKIDKLRVEYIRYDGEDFSFEDGWGEINFASEIGRTIFFTREEAEQALQERRSEQ